MTTVAFDADREEFVRVASLPSGEEWRPLALAPDGTALLLLGQHRNERRDGICLHRFADRGTLWFDAHADGTDEVAAVSPDGSTIATLSVTMENAVLSVIDVATGERRRLWVEAGGWSAESAVSWSPDGELVAVTYLSMDEEWAVAVVDRKGQLILHLDEARTLPTPGAAWTSPYHLVVCRQPKARRVAVVDVRDRSEQVRAYRKSPRAMVGDRAVLVAPMESDRPLRIVTAREGQAEPEPFITIHPQASLRLLDVAAASK